MNIENIQRGLCLNEDYYRYLSLAVCQTQETLDLESKVTDCFEEY